jgi:hypothetical protein
MSEILTQQLLSILNRQRRELDFFTPQELLESGNIIYDPFSTLISRKVVLGQGNIFYPSTVLQTLEAGTITLGHHNTFTPNCFVCSAGSVTIGNNNLFGDGGISARVLAGDTLSIGHHGRYINGAALSGSNTLGDGSQIIGPIRVQGCILAAGNDFTGSNPDERGAVLKGYGLARGLHLERGQVIDGKGIFEITQVKMQSFFHPPFDKS